MFKKLKFHTDFIQIKASFGFKSLITSIIVCGEVSPMVSSGGLGLGSMKSSGSLVVALIPSNMEVPIFVEKIVELITNG